MLWPLLLLLAIAMGCGAPAGAKVSTTSGLNFANADRLHEHWLKHRGEFEPGLTEQQYLEKARAFFADTSPKKQRKDRSNGDKLHYLPPPTNEFGVLSQDDVIRTYFRPSSGERYWERQ